jgi:glycosyltransferase involved in cell wall biosynthesis
MLRHRMTRNPVTTVWLGTDVPPDLPERTAPTSRELVYMGSFMPYKNVELLARAMHDLPGWHLNLMSRVSPETRARIAGLAPAGAITFFDGASDDDYQAALLRATALVSASKDEGFGLPVVEAMAVGTPSLLSDIPIFREIGGEPAGYFDPDDVASFVAAARELDDPEEWLRRSDAAKQRAALFTWQRAAQQLLTVLEQTLASRRARPSRR